MGQRRLCCLDNRPRRRSVSPSVARTVRDAGCLKQCWAHRRLLPPSMAMDRPRTARRVFRGRARCLSYNPSWGSSGTPACRCPLWVARPAFTATYRHMGSSTTAEGVSVGVRASYISAAYQKDGYRYIGRSPIPRKKNRGTGSCGSGRASARGGNDAGIDAKPRCARIPCPRGRRRHDRNRPSRPALGLGECSGLTRNQT